MREDFSFDTTGVVRKIVRKLAGLIGLTIALYVPFAVILLMAHSEGIQAGTVTWNNVLLLAAAIEVIIITLIMLAFGAFALGRKSIEWLND